MNKILIALLVFGGGALVYYVLSGNTESLPAELQVEEDVSLEEVAEALEDTGPRKTYGSCNVIAESSTCVDYVGSMWAEDNSAELNCADSGTFSRNTCPYSTYGGCQTSGGSVMEMIVWMYPEGGGEIDPEAVPYARAACEANPIGKWVMPDDFLQ